MTKHFLYLTNDKLVALVWHTGAIVERDVFNASDADTPEFAAYLAKHKSTPAYLVTDLIEEDFRVDTAPHLRGSDRDAVLNRKLNQLYRASTFRHAIVQGREEEGRRDDRVLYHAVTNADLLKPWIDAIDSQKIPLTGVYSSAVLSVCLPEVLGVFFTHTLLVTIVPDFGLRQTYFRNKQIRFSRLTPIIYDEARSVGDLIAAETSRTWQYLDSLRNFAGDDTLEVCILIHARDREMVAEAIRAYPLLKYRFLDIEEVATRVNLKPAPTSSHAEELLVHMYAQSRLENHFADSTQTRFALFRRARMSLVAVTAGILCAAVFATGFNLYQATRIGGEIDRQSLTSIRLQAEYQNVSAEMRQQTAASDVVRDASFFYARQIKPLTPTPAFMLNQLSDVFAAYPRVVLHRIDWVTTHDANASPVRTMPPAVSTAASIRSEVRAGAPGSPTATATPAINQPSAASDINPPLAGNKVQIAEIDAAIAPFDGNLRATLEEIDQFVEAMNHLPGVKATLVSTPLDTRPVATIIASEAPRGNAGGEARFTLKVIRMLEAK